MQVNLSPVMREGWFLHVPSLAIFLELVRRTKCTRLLQCTLRANPSYIAQEARAVDLTKGEDYPWGLKR